MLWKRSSSTLQVTDKILLRYCIECFLLSQKGVCAIDEKVELDIKFHLQSFSVFRSHWQGDVLGKPGQELLSISSIEGLEQLFFKGLNGLDGLFEAFKAILLQNFKGAEKIVF